MTERKPYPSDLTDAQWALIEPVLTAWKATHPSVSGHHGNYELREIVNAIRYQGRTGVQWDYLPHDLPPKSATYYYFAVRHEALRDRVEVKDLDRGAVAAVLSKMGAA
ncbi:transposase [Nonomuraea sp. B1E8]|uniref:transposase n=1 Tax=unclassified Nonomuraea TaxID=2593643 RepID=UPI00325E6CDA